MGKNGIIALVLLTLTACTVVYVSGNNNVIHDEGREGITIDGEP